MNCRMIVSVLLLIGGQAFGDNVTPDVIFGTGNANGSFTVDQANGVELGLRGKLRHDATGQPQNIFNSNGDGTYSFNAGVAPTQSSPTAEWSFEWAVNTDYLDSSGAVLSDFSYELSLDADPSNETSFISFDPINTAYADHAIGDNSTGNGGGMVAVDPAQYATLIDTYNVAQQSWKPHWFISPFDPTVNGVYDIALSAYNGDTLVAKASIQVIVGVAVTEVVAAPNPVAVGQNFDLTATAYATDGLASASYSFNGGTWTAMSASDGSADEVKEIFEASVPAGTIPGIYDVCVQVEDTNGALSDVVCESVVVYDPSGGFVTGGGWFTSPVGAMQSIEMVWSQDFSVDDTGWLDDDDLWYGDIVVESGQATFTGVGGSGPFSRFDGYRDFWPGTWVAEIDVYLDPAWAAGEGFDYSVAANGSDGVHQRDYIFHVGTVEDYGPIVGKALLVNGSNNADYSTNPFKLVNDNGGNYYEVAAAGWYTLQHVFYDAGGYLAVDLNLLDAGGNILWTATRENVADTIPGEVGGNRYSWFTHIDVAAGIIVDNHELFLLESPSPEGKASFGFVSKYKKGAAKPDGNTQFTFQGGDLNFHSSSYDWLVVTGSDYAKFKGEGTVNGENAPNGNPYKFMIWAGDGGKTDPDTFRIKIWSEENGSDSVFYDNGMDQAIDKGSIIIHKKK